MQGAHATPDACCHPTGACKKGHAEQQMGMAGRPRVHSHTRGTVRPASTWAATRSYCRVRVAGAQIGENGTLLVEHLQSDPGEQSDRGPAQRWLLGSHVASAWQHGGKSAFSPPRTQTTAECACMPHGNVGRPCGSLHVYPLPAGGQLEAGAAGTWLGRTKNSNCAS